MFKWTDISIVEEMEELESVVEKIQVDVGSLEKHLRDVGGEMNLACETRTCEALANSYGKEIQDIEALVQGCEKEVGELKSMVCCYEKEIQELRSFNNMVVCALVIVVVLYFFLV